MNSLKDYVILTTRLQISMGYSALFSV